MYGALKGWLVLGCVAGVLTFCALPAVGEQGNSSQSPSDEPNFKAGDTLVVGAATAKLMRGGQVLANLPKGLRILVVEARKGWVGTCVTANGTTIAGWIRMSDFIQNGDTSGVTGITESSTTSAYYMTAYRPESAEAPAQATPVAATPQPSPAQNLVPRAAVDEYRGRSYPLYETDPNIHAWEPWRR